MPDPTIVKCGFISPDGEGESLHDLIDQFTGVIRRDKRMDTYEACTRNYLHAWRATMFRDGLLMMPRKRTLIVAGLKSFKKMPGRPTRRWHWTGEGYELTMEGKA